MSYVLLHADRLRSIAAADPLIPADEVGAVRDAAALLVETRRLHDAAAFEAARARAAAHEQGLAEGRAAGLVEAAAETTATLARLQAEAASQQAQRRGDIARLAIEVLRRIAGDVGEPALIAGLAERATAALAPDQPVTVRVAPGAAEAVRDRLAGRQAITVEEDADVAALDCVLETPLGRTHAGLDTQLAAIERAWGAPA